MGLYDPLTGFRTPDPPMPGDPEEATRWNHTRLRRRMLDGGWSEDLKRRVRDQVGTRKAQAWKVVDQSSNPFRVICRELAVLYHVPPEVRHDDGDFPELTGPDGALAESGLWAQMSRFQAWVVGCRQYLQRVHASGEGLLRFRPVPPDLVVATSSADTPDQPDSIRELRLRKAGNRVIWTWDVLDVRDPDFPLYQILSVAEAGKRSVDLTATYLGGPMSGDAYPYRRADGEPILPYVLYHAERLGDRLWDPYDGIEMVEGSLNLAVGWSFWSHVLRDASWPQRYAVNAVPAGTATAEGGDHQEVITDPAVLLLMELLDTQTATHSIGQFQPGGDPEALQRALSSYGARLASDAGSPESNSRRNSGDPRSGYAISLDNAGKREAQKRYAPQFRDADQRLLGVAATLLNRATGSSLPETGWAVIYPEIPLSSEELTGRREHVLELVAAGLMSKLRAYMHLNPGLTEEQARQDLEAIEAEQAEPEQAEPEQPEPEPEPEPGPEPENEEG